MQLRRDHLFFVTTSLRRRSISMPRSRTQKAMCPSSTVPRAIFSNVSHSGDRELIEIVTLIKAAFCGFFTSIRGACPEPAHGQPRLSTAEGFHLPEGGWLSRKRLCCNRRFLTICPGQK